MVVMLVVVVGVVLSSNGWTDDSHYIVSRQAFLPVTSAVVVMFSDERAAKLQRKWEMDLQSIPHEGEKFDG